MKMWNGSFWDYGKNLNEKGDGYSSPNDQTYIDRRDIPESTSPTGHLYQYTGYLVFDYFITDGVGNAMIDFETNSSYHVLWKTSQRTHTDDDGPTKSTTFDADDFPDYYDTEGDDFLIQTVHVFGEWERLPMGETYLPPGVYQAQIVLTEESFHGTGVIPYAGSWAGAMGANIQFFITFPSDKDQDGDVDGGDLIALMDDFSPEALQDFAAQFGTILHNNP